MNATAADYKLKLDIFEGPLDLLLHLVKINEMDIQDIRIREITEQYLSYLQLMESLDLEVAGEFIVMAATLVNIKLRSLLPDSGEAEEEEEEEEVDDILTAQMLMEKLVEYRRFKEAASELQNREQEQARVYLRDVALPRIVDDQENAELTGDLETLLGAFRRVLRFADARGWHLVTEEQFSVEEKISVLEDRLAREGRIEVVKIFEQCGSRLEMIVFFLAILAMLKSQSLGLEQAKSFGPIYLFDRRDAEDDELRAIEQSEDVVPAEELSEFERVAVHHQRRDATLGGEPTAAESADQPSAEVVEMAAEQPDAPDPADQANRP